jgi:hypothetical protein
VIPTKGYCDGGELSPLALEILGRCVDAVSQNECSHNEAIGNDDENSKRKGCDKHHITYLWNSDLFGDTLNDLRQLSLIEIFNASDGECYHVVLHPSVSDWIKMRIKDPIIRCKYFLFSSEILSRLIGIISGLENSIETYSLTLSRNSIIPS